jgi:hypothetical protein
MKPNQAVPLPTDNWLRDDIGLLPLGESRPLLQLMPRTSGYFPTDDRLRDDIGLPPIAAGFDGDGATSAMTQRIALACATLVRIAGSSKALGICATAVAAVLHPRRHTRVIQQSTVRHI